MNPVPARPEDARSLLGLMSAARAGWPGWLESAHTSPQHVESLASELKGPRECVWLWGDSSAPDAALWLTVEEFRLVAAFPYRAPSGSPGLEPVMLRWAASQARSLDLPLEVSLPAGLAAERELLEGEGFKAVGEVRQIRLSSPRLEALTPSPLPLGATLEPCSLERYLAIRNAAFADQSDFVPATLEMARSWFDVPWFQPEDLVVLAVDGLDVGFVFAAPEDDVGLVESLAVLPTHRRLGFGRRLLERACVGLRERGVASVEADLYLPAYEAARSLFERLGFTATLSSTRFRLEPRAVHLPA